MDLFVPLDLLDQTFENWDDADEEQVTTALMDWVENAFAYTAWVLQVRAHHCRLVVVQALDADATPLAVHRQLGDVFTLANMSPEFAIEKAAALYDDEEADGLVFDVPLPDDVNQKLVQFAEAFELDPEETDVVLTAMLLLQTAHELYLESLDDQQFYVALRGFENDIKTLMTRPDSAEWAVRLPVVTDYFMAGGLAGTSEDTCSNADIYPNPEDALFGRVPDVTPAADQDDFDDGEHGYIHPPSHEIH